jgi:Ca-activated chloride channel family protein
VWDRWWTAEGAALAQRGSPKRFTEQPKRANPRGASFYGITTRSNRIVFVLDRSGSMRGAKLETAKDELARTIRRLSPDVRFGVVFFNHEVETWWKPPLLAEARNDTKRVAIKWIMDLPATGRTHMFQALRTALWYAEIGASDADTIFLLSDGEPTQGGGRLAGEELEREHREFLDANRLSRCIVHTIGIGPDHDRQLMRRIAHDTGGTYRAVGRD